MPAHLVLQSGGIEGQWRWIPSSWLCNTKQAAGGADAWIATESYGVCGGFWFIDRSEELLGNCEWSRERLPCPKNEFSLLAIASVLVWLSTRRQADGRFRQGGALLALLQAHTETGHRDLSEQLARLLRPARRGLPLDMAHQASIWEAALARTALRQVDVLSFQIRHCSIRPCLVVSC